LGEKRNLGQKPNTRFELILTLKGLHFIFWEISLILKEKRLIKKPLEKLKF
jgi:hypothetical protein